MEELIWIMFLGLEALIWRGSLTFQFLLSNALLFNYNNYGSDDIAC